MVRVPSLEDGYTGRMNRFARLSLGLAILLSAPGLAPYEACAQVVTGRVAAPAAGASAASATGTFGSLGVTLPAANLSITPLSPSLTPASAPVLRTAAVVNAFAIPAADGAARPLALIPAAAQALPLAAAKAVPQAAAPVEAARVLTEGAALLEAASKPGSESAPQAALDSIFEGQAARRPALDDAPLAASSDESGRNDLEPSSAREPAKGPRWVEKFNGDPSPSAPRHSLKRTLSVGFLAAIVPLVVTFGSVIIAGALGYDLHPNYRPPVEEGAVMSVLQSLGLFVSAAIMAPVAEEAIYRGGMHGTLAKIARRLRLGDFVLPALITSVIFVAGHETADPLLFGTRMVQALILSYVYKKEGILASMAGHGFFNGLLASSVVFTALGAPVLTFVLAPAALFAAWRARKFLKSQKADAVSGAVAPFQLSGALSLVFAAMLLAAFLLLMQNIFWIIGAAALAYNGVKKLKAGK